MWELTSYVVLWEAVVISKAVVKACSEITAGVLAWTTNILVPSWLNVKERIEPSLIA